MGRGSKAVQEKKVRYWVQWVDIPKLHESAFREVTYLRVGLRPTGDVVMKPGRCPDFRGSCANEPASGRMQAEPTLFGAEHAVPEGGGV